MLRWDTPVCLWKDNVNWLQLFSLQWKGNLNHSKIGMNTHFWSIFCLCHLVKSFVSFPDFFFPCGDVITTGVVSCCILSTCRKILIMILQLTYTEMFPPGCYWKLSLKSYFHFFYSTVTV